jgi:hypothetical protein
MLMGVRSFEAARQMVLASLPAGVTEHERKRLLFERLYGMTAPWPDEKDALEKQA